VKRLDIGYSDDVSVFLNARIIYRWASSTSSRRRREALCRSSCGDLFLQLLGVLGAQRMVAEEGVGDLVLVAIFLGEEPPAIQAFNSCP